MIAALSDFGFEDPTLSSAILQTPEKIFRMGVPPMRIELLTSISGVDFPTCYNRRIKATIDGIKVPVISLDDLRANKRSAGRSKDFNDLENLP